MRRGPRRRSALFLLAGAVLFAGVPAAVGGTGELPIWPIPTGQWWGSGQIFEDASFSDQGVELTWTGSFDASFDFVIATDPSDGEVGVADLTSVVFGAGLIELSGGQGVAAFTGTGD
ncbi:MAG: hypothetical protein R3246_12570, partial [Acidimicrobiia bacterium]|nr:hypothetical protein [Acidimicrobiia bacterium]